MEENFYGLIDIGGSSATNYEISKESNITVYSPPTETIETTVLNKDGNEDKTRNFQVSFDYVSATFPLDLDEHDFEEQRVIQMVIKIANFLNCKDNYQRLEYAQNRYRFEYLLGNTITLRLSGPKNKDDKRTCQIELKGQGCREYEMLNPDKTWYDFFSFFLRRKATFKRIDIAIDDFSGDKINMDYLIYKTNKGFYTSAFRDEPAIHGNKKSGLTLQFGSTKSNTELVIYDKLKEQLKRKRDVPSDIIYWLRYEMRFKNDNANAIVTSLMDDYSIEIDEKIEFDLNLASKMHLYRILDIKKDNYALKENQKTVATDPLYLEFLDNVEKGSLEAKNNRVIKSYLDYFDHTERSISLYILTKFMQCNKDPELLICELLNVVLRFKKFNSTKLAKFNRFVKQMGFEQFDESEFRDLLAEIKLIVEERILPF